MFRLFAATLALLVLTSSAVAEDNKSDPTGTWTYKLDDRSDELPLALKLEGKKLTGWRHFPDMKGYPIERGIFKDGEVRFVIVARFITESGDERKVEAKYQGTVNGDTIKGQVEFKYPERAMVRTWEAKRISRSLPEPFTGKERVIVWRPPAQKGFTKEYPADPPAKKRN